MSMVPASSPSSLDGADSIESLAMARRGYSLFEVLGQRPGRSGILSSAGTSLSRMGESQSMSKSIFDDAKKWPEFEGSEEEPQGIYRPLYVAVQAVEAAAKAKLEPPPEPPKPTTRRALDEHSNLAKIAIQLEKIDPSLAPLLIYQEFDNPLDIVILISKCSFCGERHRTTVKLLDYYRADHHGIPVIKAGIDSLRLMCNIELGPAGIQK